MPKVIPQLGLKGVWTLVAPWSADPATVYECIGVRTFASLLQDGIDPVAAFYAPVNLTDTEYQADLAAGAVLVTLASDTSAPIQVPSTYIDLFPNLDVVPYSNICASVLVGPLPDSVDLAFMQQTIAQVVEDVMGVTPTVNLHRLPSTDAITADQSTTMETARQSAITNRTTIYSQWKQLQQQYATLQTQYNALVSSITGAGSGA